MGRSARVVEVRLLIVEDEDAGVVEAVAEAVRVGNGALVSAAMDAPRPALDRIVGAEGTVTILFTDVEGSTALIEELGDERALALFHEHDDLVRAVLREHRGYEVRHAGDGVMAVFHSARRAIACAVALQRRIEDRNRARRAPALRVRMGLNTGEAIAEDHDYFGESVNLAARVAALARGGEILVSELTRTLAGDGAIRFVDRGLQRLKGFRAAHRLFEVVWREGRPVAPARPLAGAPRRV